MLQNGLLVLPLKKLAVVFTYVFIHILAASIRQILPIKQPSFKPGELNKINTDLRVSNVQKDYMPHLIKSFKLLKSVVCILGRKTDPIINQSHMSSESKFSTLLESFSFLLPVISGDCYVSDSKRKLMVFNDGFGLAKQTDKYFFNGYLHRPLPSLHRKYQILLRFILHLLVFELFSQEMIVLLQSQKSLRSPDGVIIVGFELSESLFTLMSAASPINRSVCVQPTSEGVSLKLASLVSTSSFSPLNTQSLKLHDPRSSPQMTGVDFIIKQLIKNYKPRHKAQNPYIQPAGQNCSVCSLNTIVRLVNNNQMRRHHNNLNEGVILFLGESEIITLNSNHQISLANRTLLLKESVLLTYQNPLSSIKDTKLSAFSRSKNPPISLDKLINHECQYKVTATMRVRLLIGRRDDGVESYLKELKIENVQKDSNIVAVINKDENCINGFVFHRENIALEFYESLNVAIVTQMYIQTLPESMPFNCRIINMLGETLNGRCIINPDDFAESKQEEDELNFVLDFLRNLSAEPLVNFKSYLCEMQLKFRIIDEASKDYATRFLSSFPEKLERLTLSECEITSNMFGQILPGYAPQNISERLTLLQEVNLSNNLLNDDVFTTITKLLKNSKKLQTLNLNHNNITFEKESILVSFLSAVVNIRLSLCLSNNSIHNTKHIVKYLVSAEGSLPLSELDVSFNPILPEDLATLTKAYLVRVKQNGNYEFKLHLNQLEFQEPHSFQFLQEQYKFKKPNTLSIPMTISKHVIRKRGKQLGSTEEELNKSARIEELLKNYGIEVFKGNFYKMRQIKLELRALGAEDEVIEAQIQKYMSYKEQQEQMIIKKMEKCLNFDVDPRRILVEFNETLKFCRRKGLTGMAFDVISYIKHKLEVLLAQYESSSNLGSIFRANLYEKRGRYLSFYSRKDPEEELSSLDYSLMLQMSEKELMKEFLNSEKIDNLSVFMTYHYLLSEKPTTYHLFMLETCLKDPRLASLRIARFQKDNIIQIFERIRVKKSFLQTKEQKMAFITNYGIQTYRFSQSFIQSGLSSSTYTGILSRAKFQPEQEKLVLAFVEISKNFLKYLYYTPNELSQQTIIYLNSLVAHLSSLQNESENEFKAVLTEEFFIHLMTFFDSTRYQPLKQGLLLSVCEFIARRVSIEEQLLKRISAFLMKNELIAEEEVHLHQTASKEQWEGKVDWKITDLEMFRNILLKRGKMEVKIADIGRPELLMSLEVDEMDTVLDLWQLVKKNLNKMNEFTNLSEANIEYYWICGTKGEISHGSIKYLPSYEHLGKLLFDDKYESKFYLKRVLFRPEEHSYPYLSNLKYEELVAIYEQCKENLKLTSTLMLDSKVILETITSTIWIDILIIEEVLLGNLRRQSDEQSLTKYNIERQRIVNDCVSKLYNKYLPSGFSLDESSRNSIIFQIKNNQMSGIPKNINETIKDSILTLIQNTGIAGYTTPLHDSQFKSTFFINNHEIIFEERLQPEPKRIRIKMRNILWFELSAEDQPLLKFEVVEEIEGTNMKIHRFSIQGDSFWIGLCFALLTQVAKNRLSYPNELLFLNQDSNSGFSNCIVKGQVKSFLTFPLLDVDRYFAFTLSRKNQLPAPPPPSKVEEVVLSQQVLRQPSRKQSANIPLTEEFKPLPSKPAPLGKNVEIQEIIRVAGQVQDEQQVVTSRKSANLKKEAPRRRSRNR